MDKKEFLGKIDALYDKTNEIVTFVALLNCLQDIDAEREIIYETDILPRAILIMKKMVHDVLLDVEALNIEYGKMSSTVDKKKTDIHGDAPMNVLETLLLNFVTRVSSENNTHTEKEIEVLPKVAEVLMELLYRKQTAISDSEKIKTIWGGSSQSIENKPQFCENCAFLNKVNANGLYAYCIKTGTRFELWQLDTREHTCKLYKPKAKGAGENDGD